MLDVIVQSHVDEAREALKVAKKVALEAIGHQCRDYAFELAPKDTGRLKNSMTHKVIDENSVAVGTNVEYAAYQELGTSKMNAANGGKGYLRPAVKEHIDEYRDIVKSVLEGKV